MLTSELRLSVIIPVYNDANGLSECLSALKASASPSTEIIVVDDASTDETPWVAKGLGVRVLRLLKNSGPAAARNYGGCHASGDILFFVDADVVVASDAIGRVGRFFEDHLDVAAVFGSYDAAPRATGIVSRYRNLLHHFVHQNSDPEASTFWAGCGAIRRNVFEVTGGFDSQRYPKPSIEDIELGYRLRRGGYRICLDKGLQGTHLKRWTLRSVILTDIRSRAVPWARLILERKNSPNDLNLKRAQRLSGSLVLLACPLVAAGLFRVEILALAVWAILTVAILNRDLYAFFFKKHGLMFSGASILLHLLYFLYSGLSYMLVWAVFHLKGFGAAKPKAFRTE
jgi:glycosyltransferase involved in cell wall biosynthesis